MRVMTPIFASCAALAAQAPAHAQEPQEITFFSNQGLSGARFTVTGPRTILSLPFRARSVAIRGGGRWELCPQRNYGGACIIIAETQWRFVSSPVQSLRPVSGFASNWREIVRLNVRDRADRDIALSSDPSTLFRDIKVCSERNTIRIRRAEVQLGNGKWQRLFLPLALSQGQCSDAVTLQGAPRRIRAVRFEYEAWSPRMARGAIRVEALPDVRIQPR